MAYLINNIKSSPFKGLDYSYMTSKFGYRKFWNDVTEMYNTTVASLTKLNSIKNANLIYVGQMIKLTDNTKEISYTVQKDDNLSKIAKKYNTTWQELYKINKDIIGSNPNLIKVGQVLKIKVNL